MKTLKTEFSSNRNNFRYAEAILFKANEEFKLNESDFRNLLIAVSEIVINAIVHGNKEDESKMVEVLIEYDESGMKIKICDEGNGFKATDVSDPTLRENILKASGRGLFIIKSLVEEFNYRHTDKGSEFILKVKKKQ
jgi:serine/threonine-protein kinase RsbW